jgi:hypothetical protein
MTLTSYYIIILLIILEKSNLEVCNVSISYITSRKHHNQYFKESNIANAKHPPMAIKHPIILGIGKVSPVVKK